MTMTAERTDFVLRTARGTNVMVFDSEALALRARGERQGKYNHTLRVVKRTTVVSEEWVS